MEFLIMAVGPLIGFGLAIFLSGLLFHFYNDGITEFFADYILNTNDVYYLASDLVWNAIPFIIMFLGIVCLIFGTALPSGTKRGGE